MARNRKIELSTIIGKGSKFEGTLKVTGGIRIDGEIEGNIESDGFITIAESGVARADIKAEECLVSGRVVGNISVDDAIELDDTSNLTGDIIAKVVKIHSGAIFNGSSTMGTKANKKKNKLDVEKQEQTE